MKDVELKLGNLQSTELENGSSNQIDSKYLTHFQRKLLEKQLFQGDLSEQHRKRVKIMLLADEGKSQREICDMLGCCNSTARHWILLAQSGQAHAWFDSPMGRPKRINSEYLDRLKELVSNSPRDYGYPFRRWTAHWLSKHLAKEFEIQVSDRHINRLLKDMGLSTRSRSKKQQEGAIANRYTQDTESLKIEIQDLKTATQPAPQNLEFARSLLLELK